MASESGAEIIREIEKLRDELYEQIKATSKDQESNRQECKKRTLILSRKLDAAIVKLMKEEGF